MKKLMSLCAMNVVKSSHRRPSFATVVTFPSVPGAHFGTGTFAADAPTKPEDKQSTALPPHLLSFLQWKLIWLTGDAVVSPLSGAYHGHHAHQASLLHIDERHVNLMSLLHKGNALYLLQEANFGQQPREGRCLCLLSLLMHLPLQQPFKLQCHQVVLADIPLPVAPMLHLRTRLRKLKLDRRHINHSLQVPTQMARVYSPKRAETAMMFGPNPICTHAGPAISPFAKTASLKPPHMLFQRAFRVLMKSLPHRSLTLWTDCLSPSSSGISTPCDSASLNWTSSLAMRSDLTRTCWISPPPLRWLTCTPLCSLFHIQLLRSRNLHAGHCWNSLS